MSEALFFLQVSFGSIELKSLIKSFLAVFPLSHSFLPKYAIAFVQYHKAVLTGSSNLGSGLRFRILSHASE